MQIEYLKDFDCPTLEDLTNYKTGKCPSDKARSIDIHLQACHFCAKELECIQTPSDEAEADIDETLEMPEKLKLLSQGSWQRIQELRCSTKFDKIEIGQIWSTKAEVILPGQGKTVALTDEPRLVVIVLDDKDAYDINYPEIRVAPISTNTFGACQFDLIIDQDRSPLGYEFMVECWNNQPMLKDNLDIPLGQLNEALIHDIILLIHTQFNQTQSDLPQLSANVGPVLERKTDPRIKFQEREIQGTEYLRLPVNMLPMYWQEQKSELEKVEEEAGIINKPIEHLPPWKRFTNVWHSPVRWLPVTVTAISVIITLLSMMAVLLQSKKVGGLEAEIERLHQTNGEIQKNYENAKSTIDNLQTQIAQLHQTTGPSSNVIVSLNDGDHQVILDKEGNLTGLESLSAPYQQMIKMTLKRSEVTVPREVRKLVEKEGVLMGSSPNGVPFALRSPVGTAVLTEHPTFLWQPFTKATSYEVTIYIKDPKFKVVVPGEIISQTEWKLPHPLERGRAYYWQVTAHKENEEVTSPTPPAPEAKFKVLEQSKADEIKRAKQAYAKSHLILGIIYARNGLLDDAEREFQALLRANPNSPIAQKLLQSVKSLRH